MATPVLSPGEFQWQRSLAGYIVHRIERVGHNCATFSVNTESEEELKSLLMTVKEESEKPGLKPSIQNTKIMASGPITSSLHGK